MPAYKYLLIPVALLLFAAPARAETTAFVDVNVVPMSSETVLPRQTVIVRDGRIERIGDATNLEVPESATVIDGKGRYLAPGLSEMHAHVPPAGSGSLETVLNLYLANGITLIRGMLGEPGHLELRRQLKDGTVLGPRLYTSGPSFNGNSVSSPEQGRQMVRDQKAAGYDFLKIHPGLTRDEFAAIADTANELGIPFAGHVPADAGLHRALELGIATVDHLDGYMQVLVPASQSPAGGDAGFFGLYLAAEADESRIGDIVAATKAAGTWNVPTQALFEHWVSGRSAAELRAWPEMRYMPADTLDDWVGAKEQITRDDAYSVDVADRAIEIRRALIKALHDAGAGLLLGSDAPQVFNVPGFSVHRELQYLVDAGLTPYEALRTGTVNPARYFGQAGTWGTVEEGREADLLLLAANPLEDIAATQDVQGVMLRGRWVSRAEIERLLAAAAAD